MIRKVRVFDTEQASLNVRWNYEKMIPALPVAGTEAFGILCKKLAPFGLSASRILLEAPSSNLGDAVMTIVLLDRRLGIKFWFSSFEIILDELYEDDEQNVLDIANVVFDALSMIDKDVRTGTAQIRLMYHLKLDAKENTKILSEYISSSDNNPDLIPEMAIYQLNVESDPILQKARVAIAKSVSYEDAIFIDLNLDYFQFEDITKFKEKIESDVLRIFEIFGLTSRKIR